MSFQDAIRTCLQRKYADFHGRARRSEYWFFILFTAIVGAVAGILDTILNRLAVYIEKAVKLKGQLKSAMYYPTGIMVVAIGVICVMLIKVIPTFEKMFRDLGNAKLPAATLFVVKISHGFINNWYLIFGSMIGIVVGLTLARRTELPPAGQASEDHSFNRRAQDHVAVLRSALIQGTRINS